MHGEVKVSRGGIISVAQWNPGRKVQPVIVLDIEENEAWDARYATAYLTIEEARELRDKLAAAILQGMAHDHSDN